MQVLADSELAQGASVGVSATRRSRPRMTRFERSRVLSMRSEQIANGTVPFVEKLDGDRPIDIAEREFAAGRIPFIIRRFVCAFA